MKKFVILTIAIFATLISDAQSNYQVLSSSIKFEIKNAGLTVDGSLGDARANVIFDKNNLANCFISAFVDSRTLTTNLDLRDYHIRQPAYFNIAKYPTMKMVSTKFVHIKDNYYKGYLKGITKEVVVPFAINEAGNKANLYGKFIVNRNDFDIGSNSSWVMSDDVNVEVEIKLLKDEYTVPSTDTKFFN